MYGRTHTYHISSYNYYKDLYDKTKPIRGRSPEMRPVGQRRRTWETIEKISDTAYACRLYDTDCVTYHADGSVDLFIGCYATPSTAEFIHTHSPFICVKRYNNLWIIAREAEGESKWYPIQKEQVLKMVLDSDGCWMPSVPLVVQQKVVDRKKANDARAPLRQFIQFGKAMLAMSDGWVRHDTKLEFAEVKQEYWRVRYEFRDIPEEVRATYNWRGEPEFNKEAMYNFLTTCDEDKYFPAFLFLLNCGHYASEKRLAHVYDNTENTTNHTYQAQAFDYKYSFDYFKKLVYRLADKANDIHKLVEVEAGEGALTNLA